MPEAQRFRSVTVSVLLAQLLIAKTVGRTFVHPLVTHRDRLSTTGHALIDFVFLGHSPTRADHALDDASQLSLPHDLTHRRVRALI